MASILILRGPNSGRRFALAADCTLIGRQPDVAVYLESLAVSRQHACIVHREGQYLVEDTGSSNGTYVNGARITGPTLLGEEDLLQIGPYVLTLRPDRPSTQPDPDPIVRASIDAVSSNYTLFNQNPAYKLKVVLEIAQQLGNTLDQERLLGQLLEQLFRLFPQADRGMVLLCERERLLVGAQRSRVPPAEAGEQADFPYSKTLVGRALDEGVGLLSEDVGGDRNLVMTATLLSLNLRSFLCVPLIGWEDRRLGVLQLDCLRSGQAFRPEDLEVLTAVAIQVAVALQNALFHAEQLREERLRQELLLARDIQQSFLPTDFDLMATVCNGTTPRPELFARVHPAREVSGDVYDFFLLPDGRLAFYVGDVSGKGMPAALFMIAVRTLSRHLAPMASGPADLLHRLNVALAADNPTALFVTLVYGLYDPRDGAVVLAAGGHPPPLLRRADGQVDEVSLKPGVMLGCSLELSVKDTHLTLAPEQTLILYTDGFTEGFAPDRKTMFGLDRLRQILGGPRTALSLRDCAEEASAAIEQFTRQSELQDDQTLLLLRRR